MNPQNDTENNQQPVSSPPQTPPQWMNPSEYKNAPVTSAVAAPPPAANTENPSLAKWAMIFQIGLAVSVVLFLVATFLLPSTGLFVLHADSSMSRGMDAYPLIAISAIAVLVSYFTTAILLIVRKNKGSRVGGIVMLVLGILLAANPIGLFILMLTISCNLSPCSGS